MHSEHRCGLVGRVFWGSRQMTLRVAWEDVDSPPGAKQRWGNVWRVEGCRGVWVWEEDRARGG